MCAACGHQASVIAGTIFQGTRIPLSVWFRAIWWVVSQKRWCQRAWPTARAWLGQLPHGVDVAAQAATRDGAAWPGPGVGGGRGGRDPRGRARGGRRPPTPGEEGAGGHCGRGAGPGHRPYPDAAGGRCLSRQPADVRAARGATWFGGDHRRAPELPPPAQARLSPRPESAPWSWRVGRGGLASRPPGCVAPQALAPGYASGRVSREHLDYYLDEFTFRFNRRTSRHRGKLFHRLLEQAVAVGPVPYAAMVKGIRGRKKKRHHNRQ